MKALSVGFLNQWVFQGYSKSFRFCLSENERRSLARKPWWDAMLLAKKILAFDWNLLHLLVQTLNEKI
jgi:hypothetical protein